MSTGGFEVLGALFVTTAIVMLTVRFVLSYFVNDGL